MTQRKRSQSIGLLMTVVLSAVFLWALATVAWPVPVVYADDPGIEITKSPDSQPVQNGDTVTFTIRLTNTSGVTLPTVTVSDTLAPDCEQTFEDLANQANESYTCTVTGVTVDFTNTVIVTGTPLVDPVVTDTDTALVYIITPTIEVVKSPDSQPVQSGDTVTFTIRLTNTGNVTLPTVTVSDTLAPDCERTFENLAKEASQSYTCTVTGVTVDFTNTVIITGTPPVGAVVTDTDTAFGDVLPSIAVTKTADPTSLPEPGGTVTFTVRVDNTSLETVALTLLEDDLHGNLHGQGTCSVPRDIAISDFYTCTFTAAVSNAGVVTDTVTATVSDDEDNSVQASDDAAVTVTDILPTIVVTKTPAPTHVDEPGGTVEFTVQVDNTSVETVTLTSLEDDLHGNLHGQGTCLLPRDIAISDFYTCTFTATVSGNAGDYVNDRVTATAEDDENNEADDSDTATVSIDNVEPSIAVTKTANPTSVPEPGGTVEFTVQVDNTSVETVTLTSLEDDLHGDLDDQGTCSVPQIIAISDFYTCTFTATVSGNANYSEIDTVTAQAQDDEGYTATDSDPATVSIDDVEPSIAVTKTADPMSVPEPGGTVEFTVRVDNTSVETVTLTSLVDDLHGNLHGQGTCSVPQTIATGEFYQCAFTATVSGNANDIVTDTVTAQAEDDDGNTVSENDDATVIIQDVLSDISVIKVPAPTHVPEPGGTVTFNVWVYNTTSIETVTLTSLVDDLHDDLDGQGTCSVPQTIAPTGLYQCAFTATVSGNAGHSETDQVTATAVDDENNEATDSDTATVSVDDVKPSIAVTKTANPTHVDEPGGTVEFTVRVKNTSVERVTLTSLVDDVHGNLHGQGTCSVPRTIATGGFYECAFTATVSGNAGDSVTDTVTAWAQDDEENPATDSDPATVSIDDVEPSIAVTKTAKPTHVEPGGTVEFTVRVENTSVERVTLTSLVDEVDDVHSNLDGQGNCSVPRTIATGGFYQCAFTATVSGNAGVVTDIVTAQAQDDEENPASDQDDATVTIDAPPMQKAFLPVVMRPLCWDFETGDFADWQHGGELAQSVSTAMPHSGSYYSALLGSPGYGCNGHVPVGSAWMSRTLTVPSSGSPTLSFWYRIYTQDKNPRVPWQYDYFAVYINGSDLVVKDANTTQEEGCGTTHDLGRRPVNFSLDAYKGQTIEIVFYNYNRDSTGEYPNWYNTYTYVDDVCVSVQ